MLVSVKNNYKREKRCYSGVFSTSPLSQLVLVNARMGRCWSIMIHFLHVAAKQNHQLKEMTNSPSVASLVVFFPCLCSSLPLFSLQIQLERIMKANVSSIAKVAPSLHEHLLLL